MNFENKYKNAIEKALDKNVWIAAYSKTLDELGLSGAYFIFESGERDGFTRGEATYRAILEDAKILKEKGFGINIVSDTKYHKNEDLREDLLAKVCELLNEKFLEVLEVEIEESNEKVKMNGKIS